MQYFARVASVGSIREASRQLNVSPSAVSRQIQQLQDRLDVQLFYNLGNTLRLSPAGEALLKYCNEMDASLDNTVTQIGTLSGNFVGTLRIASVDSFANFALANLLGAFALEHPNIRISAHIAAAQDVAENVRNGSANIGFTFSLAEEDILEKIIVRHCPTQVAVSKDHPLAQKENVTFEDCLGFNIGILSPSTKIRQELELASTLADAPWPKCIETNSFNLLRRLALSGQYVTFQPKYPNLRIPAVGSELAFLAIEAKLPSETEEFAVVIDRRIRQSTALSRFADFSVEFLTGKKI